MILQDLDLKQLTHKTALRDLPSYALCLDIQSPGRHIARAFECYPSLPGAIVMDQGQVRAVISRRIFLERLSQPYGIEIFLKRPIASFLSVAHLTLPPLHQPLDRVAKAVESALDRPDSHAYEPILVVGSAMTCVYQFQETQDLPDPQGSPSPWTIVAQSPQDCSWSLIDFRTLLLAQTHILALQKKQLKRANRQVKKTQNQLIAQEKMASLGSLTAGIAHEIRNPLNFINNFSQLSGELVEELRDFLEEVRPSLDTDRGGILDEIMADLASNLQKIQTHGQRAETIIQGMLLHSRGGPRRWEQVDLNTLLASAANLAFHGIKSKDLKFNVAFTTDFDPTLEPMEVVIQDLDRVFINILSNACSAVYSKFKTQSHTYHPEVAITTQQKSNGVEIKIRDNGSGIPDKFLTKIFDPFFTTKPTGEGTGLGLFLSHEIITQQHQGQLQVNSSWGDYTEFVITLPLVHQISDSKILESQPLEGQRSDDPLSDTLEDYESVEDHESALIMI